MDILVESINFEYDMINIDYDDMIIDKLCEAIDTCDNSCINVLTESIECNPLMSDYSILIETTENINNIKSDIKNIKKDNDKENIFKRAINVLKKLLDWWYKETPDKKFASLRLLLKLVLEIISLIILVKAPGSGVLKGAIDRSLAGNTIRNIAYKGNSKLLTALFSQEKILLNTARIIYLAVFKFIKKMDEKVYKNLNSKRIHEDIKEYDKTIDKLNELIESSENEEEKEELKKQKYICENTLAALIKIRDSK